MQQQQQAQQQNHEQNIQEPVVFEQEVREQPIVEQVAQRVEQLHVAEPTPISNPFALPSAAAAPAAIPVQQHEQQPEVQHQPTLSELIAQEDQQEEKWPLASPDESDIRASPTRSTPGRKIFKAKAGQTQSLEKIIDETPLSDEFHPTQECQRDAADLAAELQESKLHVMNRVMHVLGKRACWEILAEVMDIQANGGEKTADGVRFRAPGGIFFRLLKQRPDLSAADVKWFWEDDVKQIRVQRKQQTNKRYGF